MKTIVIDNIMYDVVKLDKEVSDCYDDCDYYQHCHSTCILKSIVGSLFHCHVLKIHKENDMKQIALSLEQMKRLVELGVDTSAASCRLEQWGTNKLVDGAIKFLWGEFDLCIGYNKDRQECSNYRSYPTFTLQDLLDIIPPRLDKKYQFIFCKVGDVWVAEYSYGGCDSTLHTSTCGTALETIFDMLVWVTKNLYLPKKFLKKTI